MKNPPFAANVHCRPLMAMCAILLSASLSAAHAHQDTAGSTTRRRRMARFDRAIPSALDVRRLVGGELVFRPQIDGRDQGWFLFDSGSSTHVISTRVAKKAGLDPVGKSMNHGLGESVAATVYEAGRLTIGPATFRKPRFTAIDLAFLSKQVGVEMAGILGCDLLAECVVEFDHRGGSIALRDPRRYRLSGAKWKSLQVVDRRPCARARIEEHRGLLLLDTGSDGALTIYGRAVDRFDLLTGRSTARQTGAGVSAAVPYRVGVLKELRVGGRLFENIGGVLFGTVDRGDTSLLARPDGHVGRRLMTPFTVIFDCGRQRFAMKRHKTAKLGPDDLDQLAGVYEVAGGDRRVIRREGDRLVSRRNRRPEVTLTPSSPTRFYFEGTIVYCEFVRDASGRVTRMTTHRPGRPPETATRVD